MPPYSDQLNREIYRRALSGVVAHSLFLFLIYILVDDFYTSTLYKPIPMLLLVSGILLRFICYFLFKNNELLRKGVLLTGTILMAVGWAEFAHQLISFFGLESIQAMITLGVLSTMVAISVSSLAAYPPALIIFLTITSSYPCYVLFSQDQYIWLYIGFSFLVHYVYQIIAGFKVYNTILKQIKDLHREKREKQRLQEIIDSIPSLVLIINNNNTYEMVNNFHDGFFQKILLGQDLGTLPDSPVERLFEKFLNSDNDKDSIEIQAYDFGPEEWYMVTMNRLDSDRGIICNVLPITDIVKTRNELQIHKARSEYSSRLVTLGEVAANITHELGNPLAIIKGSVQVLKSELECNNPSDIVLKKLNVIDNTANRMGGIIRGLKSISQNEGLDFKNVAFKEMIEAVREITHKKMISNNIALIINGEDSNVELFCDEVQLTQVILNLVENAIDAISDLDKKWICITYRPSYQWCDILVQDSGRITSQEIKDKMMLPFFTTKSKEKGTGLGLSLSDKIIKEHQGVLSYQLKEERTTFKIRLPRMTLNT